jgi:hypothetical protein
LRRRANHLHIFIVARIEPAPEEPVAGFSNQAVISCDLLRASLIRWPRMFFNVY